MAYYAYHDGTLQFLGRRAGLLSGTEIGRSPTVLGAAPRRLGALLAQQQQGRTPTGVCVVPHRRCEATQAHGTSSGRRHPTETALTRMACTGALASPN